MSLDKPGLATNATRVSTTRTLGMRLGEGPTVGTPGTKTPIAGADTLERGAFVILCDARSGSGYLCNCLDSHPEIACHHELYNPDFVGCQYCVEVFSVTDPKSTR